MEEKREKHRNSKQEQIEKFLKLTDENKNFGKDDIEARFKKEEYLKKMLEIKKHSQMKASLKTSYSYYNDDQNKDFFSIRRIQYPNFEKLNCRHEDSNHYDLCCKTKIPCVCDKNNYEYIYLKKPYHEQIFDRSKDSFIRANKRKK